MDHLWYMTKISCSRRLLPLTNLRNFWTIDNCRASNGIISWITNEILFTPVVNDNFHFSSFSIQTFLDFCSFDFRNFWFNAVYNFTIYSFRLVPLSTLKLGGFHFLWGFFMCPHINSVNQGMPVIIKIMSEWLKYLKWISL